MIKALRIDERLIHGQVAGTWCNALSLNRIVIADDKAAQDELQTASLKLAAPGTVKVAVRTVEEAIRLLQDPRMDKFSILILVSRPKDALKVIQSVPGIPLVNLGNLGITATAGRKQIEKSVFITDEDVEVLREIVKLLPESNYQMTPSNPAVKLSNLLK